MNKRTTVRLPTELLNRAKRKAAAEGRTLNALIVEGLWRIVAEQKRTAKGKRNLPRTSSATGGLRPGMDLTRLSDIQHADDLEYVQRMKHLK